MAVYTHISESDLSQYLENFDIGTPVSFTGIEDGVENTNYRLTTATGDFILTLLEKRVSGKDLPFFTAFMAHLNKKNIPCPHIVPAMGENETIPLCGKPCIISTFLQGTAVVHIKTPHAAAMGEMLGEMHLAAVDFTPQRDNTLSLPAWKKLIESCGDKAAALEKGLAPFLKKEISYIEERWPKDLPSGAVHTDLFPDNVFFTGEKISGVIDFYFSCTDVFAYDLMLTLNAWCFDDNGKYSVEKSSALLDAYQKKRPLSAAERQSLPFFGRAAALRIVSTRLYDYLHPVKGAVVKTKDPMEYARILKFYQTGKMAA